MGLCLGRAMMAPSGFVHPDRLMPAQPTSLFSRFFFGLALVIAALPCLYAAGATVVFIDEVWQGRASLHWKPATAVIERSTVEVVTRRYESHRPRIRYSYDLGDRIVRSTRIEASTGYGKEEAAALAARYPVGAIVTIVHDGKGRSALLPGVRSNSYVGLGLYLLLDAFLIWTIVKAVRSRRRARSSIAGAANDMLTAS
jgi:hypothetical protein